MLENQQSYSDPRANNAQDFQPPTNNPQSIPNQSLQQQSSNLQGLTGSQEALGAQQNSTIQVPRVTPRQSQDQSVTTASPDYLLGAIVGTLIVVVAIIVFIKKQSRQSPTAVASAIGSPVARFEKVSSEPKAPKKSDAPVKTKKSTTKKSKKTATKQKRGKKKK